MKPRWLTSSILLAALAVATLPSATENTWPNWLLPTSLAAAAAICLLSSITHPQRNKPH